MGFGLRVLEQLRAEVLAGLECVDAVAINPHPTAVEAIQAIRPDVYVKGPDYADMSKDVTGKYQRRCDRPQQTSWRSQRALL